MHKYGSGLKPQKISHTFSQFRAPISQNITCEVGALNCEIVAVNYVMHGARGARGARGMIAQVISCHAIRYLLI